jgi:hypothetical protein
MAVSVAIRAWLVPPLLVPLMLVILVAAIAVSQ